MSKYYSIWVGWEMALVILCAIVIAFFQLRYLHIAALPVTDESTHAETGRMIWEGYMPYRDFSYGHPLVLPMIIGTGLQLFHGMYPLRLLYVLFNCLGAIPLYLVLDKLGKNRFAALLGTLFYLSYHQMMAHDARFFASRQTMNLFFILFMFVSVAYREKSGKTFLQWILGMLCVFTLYQSAFNLFAFSVAHILSSKKKVAMLFHYVIVGMGICIPIIAFLIFFPSAWERTVLVHFYSIAGSDKLGRILILFRSRDSFFYLLSLASLLVGFIKIPSLRWYCFAMVAMVVPIFTPPEFFPHYFVIAAPAFAFGICIFGLLIRSLAKDNHALGYSIAVAALCIQFAISIPPLLQEWNESNENYYARAKYLSTLPGPLLTFTEPIHAIDANQTSPYFYLRADARTYPPPSNAALDEIASKACIILLSGRDQGYIPKNIQDDWARRYTEIPFPGGERIFLTNAPFCRSSSTVSS